jgi:hypothetical protein
MMKRFSVALTLALFATIASAQAVVPTNGVAIFDSKNVMVGQITVPYQVTMRLPTGNTVFLNMITDPATGALRWTGESLLFDQALCTGTAYVSFAIPAPGMTPATVTFTNELWLATAVRQANVALLSRLNGYDGICYPEASDTGASGYPIMQLHTDLDLLFTPPFRVGAGQAPAVQSFGDVPPGHAFYRFIELMRASGITGGCGGGNFCPDNPVTRGQMAVFLAQVMGLRYLP